MKSGAHRDRGFTLVELLVSMGVIAVLLGLIIPSLGAARETASSVVCLTNLRSAQAARDLWSKSHGDLMPTPFHDAPRSERVQVGFDQANYYPTEALLSDIWIHVLETRRLGASKGEYEPYSCPRVFRTGFGIPESDQAYLNPHRYAIRSYYASAVLTSDPEFWWSERATPPGPESLTHRQRQTVRIHGVRQPSRKVTLAERMSFHDRVPRWSHEEHPRPINAVCMDGHAETVHLNGPTADIPSTRLGFQQYAPRGWDDRPRRVPFLTTVDGYHGVDLPVGAP